MFGKVHKSMPFGKYDIGVRRTKFW